MSPSISIKLPGSGEVAQLGERRVRNAKVGSSILLLSTKCFQGLDLQGLFLWAIRTSTKSPTFTSKNIQVLHPPCHSSLPIRLRSTPHRSKPFIPLTPPPWRGLCATPGSAFHATNPSPMSCP